MRIRTITTIKEPLDLTGAMGAKLTAATRPMEYNSWINYIRAEIKKGPTRR